MSESIKAKADRLFGDVFGTSDFGPLLKAIANSEWTPEDAGRFKSYMEGQEAGRERCAKIAEGMTCVYSGPSLRVEGFDLAKTSIAAQIRGKDCGGDPPQAKQTSCESDGLSYTTNPIQYKCRHCGCFWVPSTSATPTCISPQAETKSTEEI